MPLDPHGHHGVVTVAPEPPRPVSVRLREVPLGAVEVDVPRSVAARKVGVRWQPEPGAPPLTVDARVLVLSADGNEPGLAALLHALQIMGTPYTLRVATQDPGPLTASELAQGDHGRFQAILLATSQLAYEQAPEVWGSALAADEWAALLDYQARFGVRQVTWYTLPTPAFGFGPVQEVTTLAVGRLTPDGHAAFPSLARGAELRIDDVWIYAADLDPGAAVTPLMLDEDGRALAAVRRYADGRENLALTFDHSRYHLHSIQLAYDVIRWATRGLFLGERHVYLSAQIDDLFLDNDMWNGTQFRITGFDLEQSAAWQTALQGQALTSTFRLDMAFNGEGAQPGRYLDHTLTAAARRLEDQFKWLSHTFTHLNLDAVDVTTATSEYEQNNQTAADLGLRDYTSATLVTPQVSGLYNSSAMQAARTTGVRFVVSDTSKQIEDNPTPNAGLYNLQAPGILQIPRHPTNLFFNVATPQDWVGEYNELYETYWGRALSYAEILELESEAMLAYLLWGDIDPLMFHQANLHAYDGTRSLLSDLVDLTLQKYRERFEVPILSPTMEELGARMADRMAYDAAQVTATIIAGEQLTITAQGKARVPVTGLSTVGAEAYGPDVISWISLEAGQSVTLPLR